MGEINKKYKTEIITKGNVVQVVEKIPFSSPRATYMTYGGIPLGRATEFFGPENGGKTTSALIIAGQAQKFFPDRRAVFFDLENTLDEEWATKNGVNVEELVIAKPNDQTAEQILQMVLDIIDSEEASLIVVDSLPMLVPQQLYDADVEKKSFGGISGPLTEFCRRVSPRLARTLTAFIGINQSRENMGNPYDLFHSPGGRAWKHLCSLRLFFRRGSFINEKNEELKSSAEEPHGNLVDIRVVKTKICKPDRRIGQYTLWYGTGVDKLGDTVFMAIKFNIIGQKGSWFYLMTPETGEIQQNEKGEDLKFQGKPGLLEHLREDKVLFAEIYDAVQTMLED